MIEYYTKTSGPFRGYNYSRNAYSPPKHWIDNNGTFARDERAIGKCLFSQLVIKYHGNGYYVLEQSDGYRTETKARGNLNKILYKAEEIKSTWCDKIVTDYNNGWLEFNEVA